MYIYTQETQGAQPYFCTKNASDVTCCLPIFTGSPIHHLVNPRGHQKKEFARIVHAKVGTKCAGYIGTKLVLQAQGIS